MIWSVSFGVYLWIYNCMKTYETNVIPYVYSLVFIRIIKFIY